MSSIARVLLLTPLLGLACTGGEGEGGPAKSGPRCTQAAAEDRAEEINRNGAPSPAEGTCSIERALCPAHCTLGGCSVASDVEIVCSDPDLSRGSMRVAPTSRATYLALSGAERLRVFELSGAGEGRELPSPLPADRAQQSARGWSLAVDSAERVHALGADSGDGGRARSYYATFVAGAWKTETLAEGPFEWTPRWLELDRDDVPHALMEDRGLFAVARGEPDGSWTLGPTSDWGYGFTLDDDGGEVQLRVTDSATERFVELKTPSGVRRLATGGVVRVTQAPRTAAPNAPGFAVGVGGLGVVSLAWMEGTETRTLAIPGVSLAQPKCADLDVDACPAQCHEQSLGFERYTYPFDVGRTEDGVFWLAYVLTRRDQQGSYSVQCNTVYGAGCLCLLNDLQADRSTGELHVLRVTTDGAPPVEVLSQTVASCGNTEQLVHVRTFGGRVAVALALRHAPAVYKTRVITFDVPAH